MANRSYQYGIGKPSFFTAIATSEDGSAMRVFTQEWSSRIAFAKLAKFGKLSDFRDDTRFTEQEMCEARGVEPPNRSPRTDYSVLDLY